MTISSTSQASPKQATMMLVVGVALIVVSGIAPHNRIDWILENVLPIVLILTLTATYQLIRLSPYAYVSMLLLLTVHELGAYYTYAKVPYDTWAYTLTDRSLNTYMGWERNQYDRIVHFSYGSLIYLPLHEVLRRRTHLNALWLATLTINAILSTSALYELIEWVGGEYLGEEKARDFLATQRDPWDAQKDMALALLGAILLLMIHTLVTTLPFNRQSSKKSLNAHDNAPHS